jgi:hypothetical protein
MEDRNMNKKMFLILIVITTILTLQTAYSEPLAISKGDNIVSVLTAAKGKRVTVRLDSGEEMTGIVRDVTGKLLHLGELSGREFFDAAVSTDKVAAVIVRVRDK